MEEKNYKELAVFSKNKIFGYVKCDSEDYETIKNYRILINSKGYPIFNLEGKTYRLHRWIMGNPTGLQVDHINHDKLDVRKNNLRIVNNQTNCQNRQIHSNNTTGYRGVSKTKTGKYYAYVGHNYKKINCGIYEDVEDAAQASANKRAELGYLDEGILPKITPVEHKRYISDKSSSAGISWNSKYQKWSVKIWTKEKEYWFGYHDTLEKAEEKLALVKDSIKNKK